MKPMNWFKKNKAESGGCPFGVSDYNENCDLRHCDRIETCKKKSASNHKPSGEQQSAKGQIRELQNYEKADPNPVIEFYKKAGTFEIVQRHSGKSDPLEKSNSLKCSQCGKRFIKTQSVNAYKCHRCGKVFCPTHHLPQNHKYSGKRSWNLFRFLRAH